MAHKEFLKEMGFLALLIIGSGSVMFGAVYSMDQKIERRRERILQEAKLDEEFCNSIGIHDGNVIQSLTTGEYGVVSTCGRKRITVFVNSENGWGYWHPLLVKKVDQSKWKDTFGE